MDPGHTDDDPEDKKGHLTVTKDTTSTPANGETYALDEKITYEITVTNDGNLTITDIVITDELEGATITAGEGYTVNADGTASIASLAPGAKVVITAEYVVTDADILEGMVKNTATGKGKSPDPEKPDVPVDPGEKEDPTDDPDPKMTVEKTVTSTPANGTVYGLGETITYAITVTNEGNVPLTNVVVTDELEGATIVAGEGYTVNADGTASVSTLAVDANVVITAQYVVTGEDILAGSVKNSATATADPVPDPIPDPDDDPEPTPPTNKGDNETPVAQDYTLTVRYWVNEVNGEAPFAPFTATYAYGTAYNVASPNLLGHLPDQANVTGTLLADTTVDVIYTPQNYNLLIHYVFLNGNEAAPDYTETLVFGSDYNVPSPAVAGFNANPATVTGAMTEGRDVELTVFYTPIPAPVPAPVPEDIVIDDFGTPLGLGALGLNAGELIE